MTTFFLIYAIGIIIANHFLFYKVIKGEKQIDIYEYVILSSLSWLTVAYMVGVYIKNKK